MLTNTSDVARAPATARVPEIFIKQYISELKWPGRRHKYFTNERTFDPTTANIKHFTGYSQSTIHSATYLPARKAPFASRGGRRSRALTNSSFSAYFISWAIKKNLAPVVVRRVVYL
ncbi:hypothetical protein EVAR_61878_1 [Eumeta japonica]|uniref:Uncharacterized protein n=1 Tax=Eumeta variegata TaxID=151549 RepID=A0A4C1Z139_EUMVA|nr:hypothetical protein EVAR_61878_1 [Eumeta japonica]